MSSTTLADRRFDSSIEEDIWASSSESYRPLVRLFIVEYLRVLLDPRLRRQRRSMLGRRTRELENRSFPGSNQGANWDGLYSVLYLGLRLVHPISNISSSMMRHGTFES